MDISFNVLQGEAPDVLPAFVKKKKIGSVVADFLPLRKPIQWLNDVAEKLPKDVAFCQVNFGFISKFWSFYNVWDTI